MRHLVWMLALTGCGWEWTNGYSHSLGEPLWDAVDVVATQEGLYTRLPETGGLALVAPGAEPVYADVGAGRVVELVADEGGERVAALIDRTRCVPEDERDARGVTEVSDCLPSYRVVQREVAAVAGGSLGEGVPVPAYVNTVSWMPTGNRAVGWMDADQPVQLDGVVDPSSMVVMDLDTATASMVRLGFVATDLLFSGDGTKALALSRSEVAVVDIGAPTPVLEVVFPLTLDAGSPVTPTGVQLTPDGSYALVSVASRSDLYVLDLVGHSVNLLTLSGSPSDILVIPELDKTAIVYRSLAAVDIIDHDVFDVVTLPLAGGATDLQQVGDRLLASAPGSGRTATLIDADSLKTWAYRMENPVLSMAPAPGGEFAVALTRAESGGGSGLEGLYDSHPGLEVLDLRRDSNGEVKADTHPYILESAGIGLAFAMTDTSLEALVLQEGLDYLFALDLYTGQQREVALEAPPVALGVLPAGPFWITHDAAFGLVSFLEPLATTPEAVGGFATYGMLESELLVEEGS